MLNKFGKHDIPPLRCFVPDLPHLPVSKGFREWTLYWEGRQYRAGKPEDQVRVNPLLGYAAQHWGNHARKALEQNGY
jgi:hypothetical protein